MQQNVKCADLVVAGDAEDSAPVRPAGMGFSNSLCRKDQQAGILKHLSTRMTFEVLLQFGGNILQA